ncbi:MAG: ribosome-associated translation inhibitor RaiA [Bdellovibrionales bacterium]
MRIDFKFRHTEHSEELTDYVNQKVQQLDKYELKPVRIEFTFAKEKERVRVDIHVRGDQLELHAHAEGDNFFHEVDQALYKIARQLSKKKAKIQSHKVS